METNVAAYRTVLEMAWEAAARGNFGVGTLLLDRDGRFVATGRNRANDTSAPPGRPFGSTVAHGEIDVLTQMPVGSHSDYRMISSLEPCSMCTGAIVVAGLSGVEYLATDPNKSLMLVPNGTRQKQMPAFDGPRTDIWGDAALLIQLFSLERLGHYPRFIELTRRSRPELVRLSELLSASLGDHGYPSATPGLDEALAIVELELPPSAA